ncbi:glycosyltransferase involved in cell wall biosynthesis [Acinetobacter calcoaceticus]|uniref:Glycosyltransferase involved in cell wall biosynthesis n=1 Tax=Acinetobacter calcoaceticus TaxID=471 RepID=A0A4V2QZ62_ACICA|nr:glycosyltransferase involved in cell wall biosynthesis [Acinetobacter calcoaceticus]
MKNKQCIYFLNAGIGKRLTGIEHASLKRFKLLLQVNLNVKIITLNYSLDYEQIHMLHEIPKNCFINFYTFYQKYQLDLNRTIDDFIRMFSGFEFIRKSVNIYLGYKESKFCLKIICFKNTNKVYKIIYYDVNSIISREEIFDVKGYLSKEKTIIHQDHYVEKFYNLDNKVYLEIIHCAGQSLYVLNGHKVKFFSNLESLHSYWLSEVLENNDFIFIDKNRLFNEILSGPKFDNMIKIPIIHSTHTINPNIKNSRLNNNYKFLIENQSFFDGCIVATEEQYDDLKNDFDMKIPIYVIPPSYIMNHRINNLKFQVDEYRILSIGRISEEKRQEHMILAMKEVVKKIPHARLDLYGMGSKEKIEKLQKQIDFDGLSESVFLNEYSHNIKDNLFNAHLSLVTSSVEGFCIAILDSLEQGTPVVSYDIKYGPSVIIEDGVNGILVEDGNIQKLAQSIIVFYEYYMNSYTLNTQLVLNRYSRDFVKDKWLKLLSDMGFNN